MKVCFFEAFFCYISMRQQLSHHKLLLLGGEGFIGRNLAQYFSETNACLSVGNEKSRFEKRKDLFSRGNPYEQKISHESDIVIHLIDNNVLPDFFVEQEKKLVRNIGLNKRQHIILFSSAAIYANPDSEYGQRKQLLEKFYTEYCNERGIRLTIFRLFNTFGPYQVPYRQGSLVSNLIYNYLNRKSTEINDMEAKRDFIYSRDIAKFVTYAITNKLQGTLDIGSGRLTRIKDLISLLEEKVFKDHIDIVDKGIKENMAGRQATGDAAESIDVTGLESGLIKTAEFYKDNLNILKNYVE